MTEETNQQVVPAEPRPPKVPLVAGNSPRAIVPTDFEGSWRIAQAVFTAGMAPKSLQSAEKCTVAILHGLEVGLTPMQALQSIAVINGRPSIWGDGALGLVQASGQLEDQDEHFVGDEGKDNFKAVCILKRKGKTRPYVGEFSMLDARQAGLLGKEGPWQGYRKRMMKMRARAFALRDGFSDVLRGLSVAEEQEDVERAAQAGPQEQVPATPTKAPAPPPIEEAKPAETTEQVEEGEFTEATEETTKVATTATATDFPGDRPMQTQTAPKPPAEKAKPVDVDIPFFLDAKVTGPEKDWIRGLDEAFRECSGGAELHAEKESIMLPAQDHVSERAWAHAEKILRSHVDRLQGE